MLRATFASALLIAGAVANDVTTTSIGRFKIAKPAFINVEQYPGSEPFLLTTTFGMFVPG
jgi:hypothetical protein